MGAGVKGQSAVGSFRSPAPPVIRLKLRLQAARVAVAPGELWLNRSPLPEPTGKRSGITQQMFWKLYPREAPLPPHRRRYGRISHTCIVPTA